MNENKIIHKRKHAYNSENFLEWSGRYLILVIWNQSMHASFGKIMKIRICPNIFFLKLKFLPSFCTHIWRLFENFEIYHTFAYFSPSTIS